MSISIDKKTVKAMLDFPTKSEPNPFLKYKLKIKEDSPKKRKKNKIKIKEEDFLTRNYKIPKKKEDIKMMNEAELNNLFYKLKFYHDDLFTHNNKQDSDINYMRNKNNKIEKKIDDFERAKEIESGTEKIAGLENTNNVDYIINRINELKEKIEDAKFNVKIEEEYTSTLKYLMDDSKDLLMKINSDIISIEDKIHNIQLIKKKLNEDINKRKNDMNETDKINNFLENQIERVHEVLIEQEDKKMIIEKNNLIKEERLKILKERYDYNKKINKIKLKQYKEETIEKINSFIDRKNIKIKKEQNIVNFIVGFYFFQKYFINKNRENKNKEDELSIDMTECKKDIEFNNFMKGAKYILINSDYEDYESDEELSIKKENGKRNKNNNTNKNNYIKVRFEEIKERFDELDLKYDEFYDFFTKIISKANFSRKKMGDLNEKLIHLETKKNQYIKKVDDIILNDYKNLTDIIKNIMKYDEIRIIVIKKKWMINLKTILKLSPIPN